MAGWNLIVLMARSTLFCKSPRAACFYGIEYDSPNLRSL